MKRTKKENAVLGMFNGILGYEVGGEVNAVLDGDKTEEQFKEEITFEKMVQSLQWELTNAYKTGYLEDESNGTIIEAKHLKFLGSAKLDELVKEASLSILQDADVKDILERG